MSAIASPARIGRLLRSRSGRLLPGRARRLLGLNAAPHPRWLNVLPNAVTLLSRGGAVWVLGTLGAVVLGVPKSARALRELLPSLLGATLLVRYVIKRLVRRPRPRSARLRALVVGRHSSSSFPSGDAAAAFAGAWVLSTVWPRLAPICLAIAAGLGLRAGPRGCPSPERCRRRCGLRDGAGGTHSAGGHGACSTSGDGLALGRLFRGRPPRTLRVRLGFPSLALFSPDVVTGPVRITRFRVSSYLDDPVSEPTCGGLSARRLYSRSAERGSPPGWPSCPTRRARAIRASTPDLLDLARIDRTAPQLDGPPAVIDAMTGRG
jgi:hypothetical protein